MKEQADRRLTLNRRELFMLVSLYGHLAVAKLPISIEWFRLFLFMENNINEEKRYSPPGGAIFEMVCSILLILFLFLPWFSVQWGNDIKYDTYLGNNPPDLIYYFIGVCVLNFILKFFLRSTWLTVVVIWLAGMLICTVSVMGEDNNMGIKVSLFIGGYLTLIIVVFMVISVLFSWIDSLVNFTKNASRKKKLYTFSTIIVIILLLLVLPWLIILADKESSNDTSRSPSQSTEDVVNSSGEYQEEEKVDVPKYYPFEENGKSGMKDASGKIIVSAEYDKLYLEKDIIVASKNGKTYFFDGGKQIFGKGAIRYSLEEKFLTATADDEEGLTMEYFPKTKLTLEDIDSGSYTDGVFLSHFTNDTYSFYTIDGEIKAQGLSNDIFCLNRISIENGQTINTYYGFCNQGDNDHFMEIYDELGNRKCILPIYYWQLFGIDHLTRDKSEYLVYPKTFTFTIDIDDFIKQHRNNIHF